MLSGQGLTSCRSTLRATHAHTCMAQRTSAHKHGSYGKATGVSAGWQARLLVRSVGGGTRQGNEVCGVCVRVACFPARVHVFFVLAGAALAAWSRLWCARFGFVFRGGRFGAPSRGPLVGVSVGLCVRVCWCLLVACVWACACLCVCARVRACAWCVRVRACARARASVCLSACLSVCLSVCLSATCHRCCCLPSCLPSCLSVSVKPSRSL